MYDLRPKSIKTFVEDSSIALPRFQRKLTWNQKKNFNLVISVFKNYPIGVVVLSHDGNESNEKYLLDGRQRRNALSLMRNPENIYIWAKSSIGFTVHDEAEEVARKYWDYVDDYLGREIYESKEEETEIFGEDDVVEDDDEEDLSIAETTDVDQTATDDSSDHKEEEEIQGGALISEPENNLREDAGLINLLRLIKVVHPLHRPASGLTKPLDFRNAVDGLDYIQIDDNGNRYVDTEELLAWIRYRKQRTEISGQEFPPSKEGFFDWIVSGADLEWSENRLEEEVDRRWDNISSIFKTLDVLEQKLQDSTIGYLLIRDATANDEKKIFQIINTAGTSLTAVEILSAKPTWNQVISSPHPDIVENTKDLYDDKMDIQAEGVVRWDQAATLLDRIESDYIFDGDKLTFETRMTIGFKILSGYYNGGISKDDVEALGDNDNLPWGTLKFEKSVNRMSEHLGDSSILKYWQDWKNSLHNLASVSVALNYLICSLKYWEDQGEPSRSGSASLEQFQKKGVIALDRMIYEYVTGQWRGSSDSRISSNLEDIGGENSVFDPVSDSRWSQLMKEILYDGRIEGRSYVEKKRVNKRVKLLLRYYYVLSQEGAPRGPDVEVDVDHIIPTAAFEASARSDLKPKSNYMANLALLPKKPNITKSDKPLNEISNNWLKSEIERYTGITEENFPDYSSVTDIEQLIEYRSEEILNVYTNRRRDILEL